ncbi:MAG: hypothetical protein FWC84_05525, partial [Alphaproteobacteria bacterium]|nr:hypothetical protein [Alphaproteobacteria bacterium]
MLLSALKAYRIPRSVTLPQGMASQLFLFGAALTLVLTFASTPAGAEDALLNEPAAAPAAPKFPSPPADPSSPDLAPELGDEADPTSLPDAARVPSQVGESEATSPAASPAAETVVDEPALPAINAALKTLLEARAGQPDPQGLLHRREREAIAAFYA